MRYILLITVPNGAEIEIIKDNILFLESKPGDLTTKVGLANYNGGSVEVFGSKEDIKKEIEYNGFEFGIS